MIRAAGIDGSRVRENYEMEENANFLSWTTPRPQLRCMSIEILLSYRCHISSGPATPSSVAMYFHSASMASQLVCLLATNKVKSTDRIVRSVVSRRRNRRSVGIRAPIPFEAADLRKLLISRAGVGQTKHPECMQF